MEKRVKTENPRFQKKNVPRSNFQGCSRGSRGGPEGLLGGPWEPPGTFLGARSRPRGVGSPHWRVPGGYSEPRKMVRECFFEIPGGQIHIFTRVLTYRLCKFDLALGGSWALLGGFRAALGAPRCALGAPGGSREKGFGPRRAPGGGPEREKHDFGTIVVLPETLWSL